jgi:radical SAM protein with 4Fe4S-binding SPASM domain
MGFEGFPLAVGWELTLACNLRCGHCGSAAEAPRPGELSLKEALAICDQLPSLLVCEVDFTGGEPLCHPHWDVIAARLRELRIRTKLITNGVLLGPESVRRLRDAGVARVGVSVDGLEVTHDRIRGRPGLFRHVMSGLDALLAAGVPVTAITTVNDLNVGELPQIGAALAAHGVDMWQCQPIFYLGRARQSPEMALSLGTYAGLGRFAKERVNRSDARPALLPGDSFGYFTELDTREPPWGGCSAGIALCGITSDGRVKGCLSMPDELVEGSLRERDLWDVWFDEGAFSYNRKFSERDLGPNCTGCDRAAECRGGCSSMSYGYTGLLHNDPYCFLRLRDGTNGWPAGEAPAGLRARARSLPEG